jgi:hypothetical protein
VRIAIVLDNFSPHLHRPGQGQRKAHAVVHEFHTGFGQVTITTAGTATRTPALKDMASTLSTEDLERRTTDSRPTAESMTQARQNGRATRFLAVLAVLLGLLAMHALASSHHAAAALPVMAPASGAGATTAAADVTAENVHHGSSTGSGAEAAARLAGTHTGDDKGACDDACSTTVLCLAILTAAVAAATLSVRRTRPGVPNRRTAHQPGAPEAARHAPAAPDPVEKLCISRT